MPPAKRRRRIKEPRRRKKSGPLRQSVLHPVSMAPRRSPRTGTSFVVGQWNWRASKVLHEFLYEQKTRDGPLVVWGPNGTGKTALVREALREEVGEVLKVDSFWSKSIQRAYCDSGPKIIAEASFGWTTFLTFSKQTKFDPL